MCCRFQKPYGTTVLTFLQHAVALSLWALCLWALCSFQLQALPPFHLYLHNLSLRISSAVSSPGIHPLPHEDRSVCHVLLDPRCLPLSLWTVTLHWLSATCLGALGELEPVSLYPRHQALGSDAKEMFFNNQIIASCKDWNNFFGGESSIKTIDLYSTGNNFNRAILIQRHNESWHVGVWNQLHYFIGHTEEQQCILKTHLHYYTSNNNNTDSNSLATVLHQVVWQRLLVAY